MRSLLIRCYPTRWRERYGDEFLAILEERPLGPYDVADVLLGALDARLRSRGRRADPVHGKGFTMSLRIGGFAAITSTALLAAAWFLGYGFVQVNPAVTGALLVAGLALLLVAMAGLSAFQARSDPRLTWVAFALPAFGLIVFVVGAVGVVLAGEPYWGLAFVGVLTALVGSVLFAIVTFRTAALSRGAALLIGVGSVMPFFGSAIEWLNPLSIICILLGWFALGIQAIRLDPSSSVPRPA